MKTYEEMLEVLCYHEVVFKMASEASTNGDDNFPKEMITMMEMQLIGRYDTVALIYNKNAAQVISDVVSLVKTKAENGQTLDDVVAYSNTSNTVH